MAAFCFTPVLWFFELALVLVRFDHVASRIVNADHGMMGTAAVLRVVDCVRGRVRSGIPQTALRQHLGDKIESVISAR